MHAFLSGQHIVPNCRDGIEAVRPFFPPPLRILLAWSTLFRCRATFANYLGYLKTACLVMNVSTEVRHTRTSLCKQWTFYINLKVFSDPALRRAKQSIQATSCFQPREKLWIRGSVTYVQNRRHVLNSALQGPCSSDDDVGT